MKRLIVAAAGAAALALAVPAQAATPTAVVGAANIRYYTIDNAGNATGKQALVSVTTVAKVGVLTAGANVGVVNCVVSRPTSDGTGVLVITAPVLGRRLLLALIERRNGPDGAQAVSAPVANVTPGPYCGTAFNPGNFFLAPAFNVAEGAFRVVGG